MSDYQKGYAAGQRRADRDFKRAVFLTVLPELIRSPWEANGQGWKTMDQFVDGAVKFADLASRKI